MGLYYFLEFSGMNGDTMNGVGRSYLEAGLKANGGVPLALEPEVLYSNITDLQFDVMSWGYWTNFLGFVPINPIIPPVNHCKSQFISYQNFMVISCIGL